MEHSPHVFFVAGGAEAFAREQGLEVVDPSYFSTDARRTQLEQAQKAGTESIVLDHDCARRPDGRRLSGGETTLDGRTKMGTVGAVALGVHGNLAAATSTGGMTNRWPGRVGDSPVVGAGCYANNATCAISTTGKGEAFIRAVAAYDISALMAYTGLALEQAANKVVHEKLPLLGGAGGLIAVDSVGNVVMPFNTKGMYRGSLVLGGATRVAIYR